MKQIIGFIKEYYTEVNKLILLGCTGFVALLILFNYHYALESRLIGALGAFPGHLLIYALGFLPPLVLVRLSRGTFFPASAVVTFLIIVAPCLFALKVALPTKMALSRDAEWDHYWNTVLYWPLRMMVVMICLCSCWLASSRDRKLYGLRWDRFDVRPYFLMLLIMVPLISLAATQPDFLHTYPKLKVITPLPERASPPWIYRLLFELSYGTDFLTIETFFRGFLVIGLSRWLGKHAILPMACFYCTIHFGKPLGECISSYFGGMLLGIVSYHSRSIYGGLIVHLGIAWMMEAAGFLGRLWH